MKTFDQFVATCRKFDSAQSIRNERRVNWTGHPLQADRSSGDDWSAEIAGMRLWEMEMR